MTTEGKNGLYGYNDEELSESVGLYLLNNDPPKAKEYYLKFAEKGVAVAQFMVAEILRSGHGCEKNIDEALKWYHKAADQNITAALINIAALYDDKQDLQRYDPMQAEQYFFRAAEAGDLHAYMILSAKYVERGSDVKAFEYAKRAAEKGFLPARYILGCQYYLGKGTQTDFEKAIYWFNDAISKPDHDKYPANNPDSVRAMAYSTLAHAYEHGNGVPADPEMARQCRCKAAELNGETEKEPENIGAGSNSNRMAEAPFDYGMFLREIYPYTVVCSLNSSGFGNSLYISADGTLRDDNGPVHPGWSDLLMITTVGEYRVINYATGATETPSPKNAPALVGLTKSGRVIARGLNRSGQCDVENWPHDIVSVVGCRGVTIGLRRNGTVIAAGDYDTLQCDRKDSPLQVCQWKDILKIESSGSFVYGIRKDGSVCSTDHELNEAVKGWRNIYKLYRDYPMVYGIRRDGRVEWANSYGECGQMNGWTDIVEITCSREFVAGLKKNGTVVFVEGHTSCDFHELDATKWRNVVDIKTVGNYCLMGLRTDGTVVTTLDGHFNEELLKEWKNVLCLREFGAAYTKNGDMLHWTYEDTGIFRKKIARSSVTIKRVKADDLLAEKDFWDPSKLIWNDEYHGKRFGMSDVDLEKE